MIKSSWYRRIGIFLLWFTIPACVPAPYWINESSPSPSCLPDRLVTWADFTKRSQRTKKASAQTAMQFGVIAGHASPRLQVRFDPRRSWVLAELTEPRNSTQWKRSEQLLAHEQLHFIISCLLVRQANHVLAEQGGNIRDMLLLVKATAQRINAQYDADTRHGLDQDSQKAWSKEVMAQFAEVSSPQFDRE